VFDFIRKQALWEALDAGLDRDLEQAKTIFHLKSIQDLIVLARLRELRGARIAEVGAGNSRILPLLAAENDCVTVEKFEGQGGGPTDHKQIKGVPNISAFLGENNPELADDSFDVVFSISVVEHVPDAAALTAFHDDQLRILKPGGLFLHAIDIYVEDETAPHLVQRFEAYRGWVTDAERVEPVGEVFGGPLAFTCDMASNPDNVMYAWGRTAPTLNELRQRAQCVSLLASGRKRAAAAA